MSLLPSGKGKRSLSTNWWSLWSGQQVLLGGKKLIIFTVQNLLNMFLSGLSSIQKEKYVERDDMVWRKNRSTRTNRYFYMAYRKYNLLPDKRVSFTPGVTGSPLAERSQVIRWQTLQNYLLGSIVPKSSGKLDRKLKHFKPCPEPNLHRGKQTGITYTINWAWSNFSFPPSLSLPFFYLPLLFYSQFCCPW